MLKAALLISGADKRRYAGLKNDLGNNYIMGADQYSDTTEKARVLLGSYKPPLRPTLSSRPCTPESPRPLWMKATPPSSLG